MRLIEKYTGEKTYMFPTGRLATPDVVREKYPAVSAFTHIVETDEMGEVMFALQNLSALRTQNNVDPALSEDEAIAALQEIINAEPEAGEHTPSPEERTAAALEAMASGATGESTDVLDALLGEE